MTSYAPEPWRVKVIEPIRQITREQREEAIRDAGWNPCLLRSEDVYIDLYSDSGTNAMSDRQWSAIMLGDEAYAGSRSFYRLEEAVRSYYGYEHVIPVHQGRAAENLLSRVMITSGTHVPGNMYFTTTRAHQEENGATFHDVVIDEAHEPQSEHPFKGNVDLDKLEAVIKEHGADSIPYVSVAATVNMAGGQPISMENLGQVHEIAQRHGIPVILDAARAVENAWFIKQRESGWGDKSVAEVLRAMCDLTEGAAMSAKKDSSANIGGWLGLRDPEVAEEVLGLVTLYEGLHTYGGMSGRDMEAVTKGIEESVREENIRFRIAQVQYLGDRLIDAGVPVVHPIGGHSVCIDALATLPHVSRDHFPAQTLSAALYLDSGVRSIERGALSAGRDPSTGENRHPKLELVRLTVPRRVYTQSHLDLVADSAIRISEERDRVVSGLVLVHEPKRLRFFRARLKPADGDTILAESS